MNTAIAIKPNVPAAKPAAIERLSWSRIQTYRGCPKQFYYRYVVQAPNERVHAALPFGGTIHRVAEKIAEYRLAGRNVPSLHALMRSYDAAWKDSLSSGTKLQFAKGEDPRVLRNLAKGMLGSYLAFSERERGKIIAVEHEATFVVAGVNVQARIDQVELRGKNLVLTDIKTSRSRWNEAKAREHAPQLVLYAWAVKDMVRELGARRILPRFVVIPKAKKKLDIQVVEPKPNQDDVARLRDLVTQTWHGVQQGVFPRHEGWQCSGCPFRNRCLGKSRSHGTAS